MPRRPRPLEARRSEHWLRIAVNESTPTLNSRIRMAFGWPDEPIQWLSPLASDQHAEYYDESVHERLGITNLRVPLHDFWPAGGPRWDALARTASGKLVLVEAKAHIDEIVDYGTRAGAESAVKINAALESAKSAYGARAEAPWHTPFYQYANRLAHLYYLRGLNELDAYLVFLYFANATDVPSPCSVERWQGAIQTVQRSLGLPGDHVYRGSLKSIILAVSDLKTTEDLERTSTESTASTR